MEEDKTPFEPDSRFIPIPKIFYSDLTGQLLRNCVSCDKDLVDSKEPYIIEKAFRHYSEYEFDNTIFEYVMCLPCAQKMHDAMSIESRQKIQEYFTSLGLVSRSQEMWDKYGNNFDKWISTCLVKGSKKWEQEEYQICAQCIGGTLVFDMLPYMISFEASDEIASLLSKQTLEEYDRFIDDNFGLPPEFKKAIKDKPSVLV